MAFFSKHTPALYAFIILVAGLVPLHLAQIGKYQKQNRAKRYPSVSSIVVIGLMIMTQHVGPRSQYIGVPE
jgi:hypothetical protein